MRIVCWVSRWLALGFVLGLSGLPAAHAGDYAPRLAGVQTSRPAAASRVRIEVRSAAGARYRVWVGRDASVRARGGPHTVEPVGEIRNRALIFIDSYPSIPGGMSYCQAGQERFLRVVSIARKPAVETFYVKVESCRDNLELASPGVEWLADSANLRINWLQGPTEAGAPEIRTLHVGANGVPD